MPVAARSQSRLAATAELAVAYKTERDRPRPNGVLDDFPWRALRRLVAPGKPLSDKLPEPSILRHLPALCAHPRRWIVERFILGAEVSDSFWLGAEASISVSQELSPVRRSKRFRSGALVIGIDLD